MDLAIESEDGTQKTSNPVANQRDQNLHELRASCLEPGTAARSDRFPSAIAHLSSVGNLPLESSFPISCLLTSIRLRRPQNASISMLPARRLFRSPRAAIISARILSWCCAVPHPFLHGCDARSGSLILSVRLEFQHDVITDLSQRPSNFVKSHAACGSPQQRPSLSRHSCMDMLDTWLYFQH